MPGLNRARILTDVAQDLPASEPGTGGASGSGWIARGPGNTVFPAPEDRPYRMFPGRYDGSVGNLANTVDVGEVRGARLAVGNLSEEGLIWLCYGIVLGERLLSGNW